jgi:Uma2 family endonuclease
VREVWLVRLREGVVKVCRDPTPEGYREVQTVRRGDRLSPLALPDVALSADDILL